jgi:hypothetical protein
VSSPAILRALILVSCVLLFFNFLVIWETSELKTIFF